MGLIEGDNGGYINYILKPWGGEAEDRFCLRYIKSKHIRVEEKVETFLVVVQHLEVFP